MDGHACWVLRPSDLPKGHVGRYTRFYMLKRSQYIPEDAEVYAPICVQDAYEEPGNGLVFDAWTQFVRQHDLWARDSKGLKIPGWGGPLSGRYAVDLSLDANWSMGIVRVHDVARGLGCNGLHLDDLAMHLFFQDRMYPKRGLAAWQRHVSAMANALPNELTDVNGGKRFYLPKDLEDQFVHLKLEDRLVSSGGRLNLQGWIEGNAERDFAGILPLDALGHHCTWEWFVPRQWDKDRVDAEGETRLATVMLADHCKLMVHGGGAGDTYNEGPDAYPGPWCETPIWCPSFPRAAELGGTLGIARRMSNGGWRRQYLHGVVGVNPTSTQIVCPGIGALNPGEGKVVVQ